MKLDPRVRVYHTCTARFHDDSQGANLRLITKDRIADSHVVPPEPGVEARSDRR